MGEKIRIECEGATSLPLSSFSDFQGNLKSLSKQNYQKLRGVILDLGFSAPIFVWKNSGANYILDGHQRLKTVQEMVSNEGFECGELPICWINAKTEKEAKQKLLGYLSQYGKLEEQGLYEYVHESEIDPASLIDGYDLPGIDANDFIESYFNEPKEGLTDDDEVPVISENKFGVELGHIWALGDHRLLCGDSTDRACVDKLMGGERADMVFTDPPYGVSYQSNMRTKTEKFKTITNDEGVLSEWIPNVTGVSDGFFFMWTTWKVLPQWTEVFNKNLDITNMIIWDKGGGGMGDLRGTLLTDYEIALVCNRGADIKGKRVGSVWSLNKDAPSSYIHPTQKPVALAELAINTCSEGSILDVFLGSGSTLIACEKTNRKCYGMEIDPHYCSIIIQRWQDYTGNAAIKI